MSAVKYHISPESGRPNICRAVKGVCPIAKSGNTEHFDTKEEARAFYENSQKSSTVPTKLTKKSKEASKKDSAKVDNTTLETQSNQDQDDPDFDEDFEDDLPDLDDWGDDLADSYCEYCGEPTNRCRCECPECYGTMNNHYEDCSQYRHGSGNW